MRLLNVNTERFEEFIGQVIPRYAILSHTWEDGEVSYQDYISGFYKHKKGYEKIKKTIHLANQSALQYAWVDTCCIDKSSSAELTEAINSMYQWYQRSALCYVYLSDLELNADINVHLSACRWFSRGWTLQELIAPRIVWFYDSQWRTIGSKRGLESELSRITRIPAEILSKKSPISSALVAHKMSWAAGRRTTRVEDEAYCLLGIVDVNMPLLYGEGDKAFRRLQEEIIKSSVDPSIFAWVALPTPSDNIGRQSQNHCGILARSPAAFHSAGLLIPSDADQPPKEFTVTNKGLKTGSLLLYSAFWSEYSNSYILPLSCRNKNHFRVAIHVQMLSQNTYVRKDPFNFFLYENLYTHGETSDCYILIGHPPGATTTTGWTKSVWTPIPIDAFRGNILKVNFPEELTPYQYWGCFDRENSVFLASRSLQTDCAGIRFSFYIMNTPGRAPSIKHECVIYVLGWTRGRNRIAYTIIDSNKHQEAIREIGAAFTQWINRATFERLLHQYGIRQSRGITFEMPELEGYRAYIDLVLGKLPHELSVRCEVLRFEDASVIETHRDWGAYFFNRP